MLVFSAILHDILAFFKRKLDSSYEFKVKPFAVVRNTQFVVGENN